MKNIFIFIFVHYVLYYFCFLISFSTQLYFHPCQLIIFYDNDVKKGYLLITIIIYSLLVKLINFLIKCLYSQHTTVVRPPRLSFIKDITQILQVTLADIYRLGQAYLSGKLYKEVCVVFIIFLMFLLYWFEFFYIDFFIILYIL